MSDCDEKVQSAFQKASSLIYILDLFYMEQTVFFWSFSQGKRDESTSVDAAKAKADAKVHSLQLNH